MSLRRNISGGPLDVPLLGRVVEAGEVADCPDFQAAHNPDSKPGDPDHLPIEWPPDKWELVEEPAVAAEIPKRAIAPAPSEPAEPKPPSTDPRER